MKTNCEGCGTKTTAMGLCRACKKIKRQALAQIKAKGWTLGEAGGGWWVWDARGFVVVVGQDTRLAALGLVPVGAAEQAYWDRLVPYGAE
jgi:hypothetical protein